MCTSVCTHHFLNLVVLVCDGYGEEWWGSGGMMRVSKNWILKKEERERESKRKRRLAAEDTNITVTKKERIGRRKEGMW